ncbi:MAG: AAA family ATPase [Alphaproteobacteria bacterium]|nr:AAA family ATPase [Alphaproteobacteria bacterium]MCB9792232.1 AAA family ATPase [Alphaproteobacteria bacterium]
MPDLLRIREAAELLGVSPRTLRRWDQDGRLCPLRHPVNGYRLYPRTQLEAFRLSEARVPARALAPERPRSRFIGRARELATLRTRLSLPGATLTLLGPPGVGKTRLAQEACAQLDLRAAFVDLSATRTLEDLLRAVAQALELPLSGALSTEEALTRLAAPLGAGELELLVLDEAEGATAPVRLALERWRTLAPSPRVLLTSRQALGASWERTLTLDPLPVSAEDGRPEALELLLARIRERRPRYRPSAAARAELLATVRALEGLPLALELAAPGLARGEPAQVQVQVLEQTLQRSWDLLLEAERADVIALSALHGAFDLALAAAALGAPEPRAALERLTQVSFLQPEPGPGAPRYRLLNFIRAFAAARAPGLRDAACARVARHQSQRVEALLHPYVGVTQAPAQRALRRSYPALEAALHDARRLGLAEEAAQLGRALLAADALVQDTLTLTEPMVEDARVSPRGRGLLLLQRSLSERRALHNDQAIRDLERGLTLAEAAADPTLRAHLATRLSTLLHLAGRPADGEALLAEAEAHFEAVGDARGRAGALQARGFLTLVQDGGDAEAQRWLTRAERAMREAGDALTHAAVTANLARLQAQRRVEGALHASLAALAAARASDIGVLEAFSEVSLGVVLYDARELAQARARFCDGAERYSRLGVRARASDAHMRVALVDLEVGDLARAQAQAEQALALSAGTPPRHRALVELLLLAVKAHGAEPAALSPELDALAARGRPEWSTQALHRLLILLIRLRAEPAAVEEVEETLAALAPAAEANQALRGLTRLVRRAAAGHVQARTLRVSADGARFRLGVAPDQALSPAPARLLAALAQARAEAPGRALDVEALVAAGWPGERMRPRSAAQRVRTAIWSLRRAGLSEAIETVEGGYRLDPALRIELEAPPPHALNLPATLALDPELQRRLRARMAEAGLSLEAALGAALEAWLSR